MSELLRTAGEVKDALCLAITHVTLPRRIPLAAIDQLRDRRERCRLLPCMDPATSLLVGAVDLWLAQVQQWRRSSSVRQHGGKIEPPGTDRDALRDALMVWFRHTYPNNLARSRRRDDTEREAEAAAYLDRRQADG